MPVDILPNRSNKTLHDINCAFFPVDLCQLFWIDSSIRESNAYQPELFSQLPPHFHLCPRHFAVVNLDLNYVYQCVTENYCLVTNKEAVDMANEIAQNIFNKSCFYDFINKEVILSGDHDAQCRMYFWDEETFFDDIEEDKWVPYICITNSYNSTLSLIYEMGFHICDSNLFVTFEDSSIRVKDAHSKCIEELREVIKNEIGAKHLYDIDGVIKQFVKKMNILNNNYIDDKDVLPLALMLFEMDDEDEIRRDRQKMNMVMMLKNSHLIKNNAYYFIKLLAKIVSNSNIGRNLELDFIWLRFKIQYKLGAFIDELVAYFSNRKPEEQLKNFVGKKYYKLAEAFK